MRPGESIERQFNAAAATKPATQAPTNVSRLPVPTAGATDRRVETVSSNSLPIPNCNKLHPNPNFPPVIQQPTSTSVHDDEPPFNVSSGDGMNKECAQKRFTVISANANSLKNKLLSLKFILEQLEPHIIVIQETKIRRKSQINLQGYRCFPTVRGDSGGGILIAGLATLDPVLIFEGDSECEVLTVEVTLQKKRIRVIAGYGPQECAPVVVRETYRNTMEEQVIRAQLSGCSIIIAEDSNAKLGPEWLADDPHPISDNGELLANMILRQNLALMNKSPKCVGGPITRRRLVNGKEESSCIDFILMSRDLIEHLESAIVDSNQMYSLTKYTTTKGIPSVKRSDHFTLIANFSLSWTTNPPPRTEIFKLRDAESLQQFNHLTANAPTLMKCFEKDLSLTEACDKWFKEFDKLIHRCFKKIRITQTPPKNTIDHEIHRLLTDVKHLKELLPLASEMCQQVLQYEINSCEKLIAELQGEKCKNVIKEETRKMVSNESFDPHRAWKIKKKLFPKCSDPPFAVLDKHNNLVTDSEGILTVMKDEFSYRLRNREIGPEYQELRELKEYLCRLRLEITSNSDFTPWTMKNLDDAINRLKNNKCKDPHGHVNELYKNLGHGGRLSLLILLNKIKEELIVPASFQLSNVSTIYKGKGSKQNVINLRGIFKLPIVRNILDRLVYFDEKDQINNSMGDLQVGNQEGRNIRDHTLIVHAIVNEAKWNKTNIDILFTDIKQCFDSMWLDEAINDLYNSGVNTRNLNLLYEGNRATEMCVETRFGRSDRVKLNKVVMQGSVPGGTLCSNQLSKFCHKTLNEGNVYMYNSEIPIPALAMVDDIVTVVLCGSIEGIYQNVKTDSFIKSKKLESQVGEGKCQSLHIGSETCTSCYIANDQFISQCPSYKYLGDVVSDGWDPLYKKRFGKAQGYSVDCQAMSTEISLGFQLYSVAKLLHQAILLNGTLVNMETWPNFTPQRLSMFERVEQGFFRKVLSAHSKTPIECIYLELGVIPFRFHLMARRIVYYQLILKRKADEITRKVVMCQKKTRIPGDFYMQVQDDMSLLQITEIDLFSLSKGALKHKLDQAISKCALDYLLSIAQTHSKVRVGSYTNLNGMAYFNDPRFTPDLANLLFKFRCRMYNVRNNFRNNYKLSNINCPMCETEDDTQEHLFHCKKIMELLPQDLLNHGVSYDDIFTNNCDTLLKTTKLLKEIVKIREKWTEDNQ